MEDVWVALGLAMEFRGGSRGRIGVEGRGTERERGGLFCRDRGGCRARASYRGRGSLIDGVIMQSHAG